MIRPATAADAATLADLWNPWITDTAITFAATPKTPDDLALMIATRPAFFISQAQGTNVQGFATYSQFRSGDGYATCMEHTIIFAPTARNKGLGRALLTAVEAHAAAHGAHQMIAGISAENPAGLAFHAAMGYTEIARLRDAGRKFDRFIDLVLMQKFLT
ncbi:MAG: N-acetyltransferase [Candidatus Saccharibacteria bacterium]|nr:N-acetyltransferase [Pseudorhodobacter sp.]